ncbi:hypothetical protein [Amycolatopsis sp. NPDC051372]|uniref:hypothetical protein n=1 Tax=Amycolatopsis sp. NPDC051372 TaxID=3155669 RepID=UPI0034350AE8
MIRFFTFGADAGRVAGRAGEGLGAQAGVAGADLVAGGAAGELREELICARLLRHRGFAHGAETGSVERFHDKLSLMIVRSVPTDSMRMVNSLTVTTEPGPPITLKKPFWVAWHGGFPPVQARWKSENPLTELIYSSTSLSDIAVGVTTAMVGGGEEVPGSSDSRRPVWTSTSQLPSRQA